MVRKVFGLLEGDVIREFYVGDDIELARKIAQRYYIDFDAIDCTYYDCHIGDIYKAGCIYHIDPVTEQQIEILREDATYGYESRLKLVIDNCKKRIDFLEKIIKDNKLGKLIE